MTFPAHTAGRGGGARFVLPLADPGTGQKLMPHVLAATVKAELKVLRQALGAAAAAQLVPLSVLEAVVPIAPRAGPRSSRRSGGVP